MPADDNHYSTDFFEEGGWFHGRCFCGWDGGLFPTSEDACDALMDHAYEMGRRGALTACRVSVSERCGDPGYCAEHGCQL